MAEECAQVPEGTNSKHPYKCLGEDLVTVVEDVEAVKWCVADKNKKRISGWNKISPPAAEGTIEVPGEINRMQDASWDDKRYVCVVATHNGGEKKTGWIPYLLVDNPGIESAEDLE